MSELQLTGLHVYPVKSCGCLSLDEARLTARGLPYDREWMVVRLDGSFVTQRECPDLALVRPAITSEGLELQKSGLPEVRIELHSRSGLAPLRTVTVWGHSVQALDEGGEAADWFSEIVGSHVRLVRFHPEQRRLSDVAWTGGIEAENAFSDGFPLLVTSEESLADLQKRSGKSDLAMSRFRPNLVVAGGAAYAEDGFRVLTAPGIELRLVKPCARCKIVNTDQETAEVGGEPLKTLASYRRDDSVQGVTFGQNAIVVRGVGELLWLGMTLQSV
jgi:uncharacterized protein YcbX